MPEISVTLIRKCHGNIGVDELSCLKVIDLTRQSIDSIDNLEVFSEIEDLRLGYNNISTIENLEFLSNLRRLDISFNKITASSLRSALTNIPPQLTEINLSGNPCCDDEDALGDFQDHFPAMAIIIGSEIVEVEGGGVPQIGLGGVNREGSVDDSPIGPLDADAIIKSIVERKCRLQNEEGESNFQNIIDDLNREQEVAINTLSSRRRFIKSSNESVEKRHDDSKGSINEGESLRSDKAKKLLEECKSNHKDSNDFMHKLRENAHASRNKLFQAGGH